MGDGDRNWAARFQCLAQKGRRRLETGQRRTGSGEKYRQSERRELHLRGHDRASGQALPVQARGGRSERHPRMVQRRPRQSSKIIPVRARPTCGIQHTARFLFSGFCNPCLEEIDGGRRNAVSLKRNYNEVISEMSMTDQERLAEFEARIARGEKIEPGDWM